MRSTFLAAAVAAALAAGPPPPGPPCTDCPNIVLLLTDDQDEVIGGWNPMNQTRTRIEAKGARGTQWRIHTPICAPSRAELQTGRYYHNVASTQKTPPSSLIGSGAVSHLDLGGKVWPYVFPTMLRKEKGYVTALFGKCMNGGCGINNEGGSSFNTDPTANLHLMGAFDRWFEHPGFVNGTFFDNTKPNCTWPWNDNSSECKTPTFPGGVWAGRGDGYDTSTLGNVTVEWIKEVAGKGRPFFIYYAPHAPHTPATPPSWYETGTFCDDIVSPRLPNWNYSGPHRWDTACVTTPPQGPSSWWDGVDFHEQISCQPYFDNGDVSFIDELARKRCKCLLSVDDSYMGIVNAVEEAGIMNNTYFLVTSDHGYNLGHHMLAYSKMILYEHSLRIPMLFMGPGIKPGSTFDTMGTQVDLAPTILGLAGMDTPSTMDGKSMVSVIVTETSDPTIPGSVKQHLSRYGAPVSRTSISHQYFTQGPWVVGKRQMDDWSNTWAGITYKGQEGYFKFGIYDVTGKQNGFSDPYMFELFDLADDPYELHNIYNTTLQNKPQLIDILNTTAYNWLNCKGATCN